MYHTQNLVIIEIIYHFKAHRNCWSLEFILFTESLFEIGLILRFSGHFQPLVHQKRVKYSFLTDIPFNQCKNTFHLSYCTSLYHKVDIFTVRNSPVGLTLCSAKTQYLCYLSRDWYFWTNVILIADEYIL